MLLCKRSFTDTAAAFSRFDTKADHSLRVLSFRNFLGKQFKMVREVVQLISMGLVLMDCVRSSEAKNLFKLCKK